MSKETESVMREAWRLIKAEIESVIDEIDNLQTGELNNLILLANLDTDQIHELYHQSPPKTKPFVCQAMLLAYFMSWVTSYEASKDEASKPPKKGKK